MRPLPLSHPPHRSQIPLRGAGLPYPICASIHGHVMATVIIEGQAQPSVVADVAPPDVVEKLRLGTIDVSTTPACLVRDPPKEQKLSEDNSES